MPSRHSAFVLIRVRGSPRPMPWKKLWLWATGQIDEALRQKLEFVLEENRAYRAQSGTEEDLAGS